MSLSYRTFNQNTPQDFLAFHKKNMIPPLLSTNEPSLLLKDHKVNLSKESFLIDGKPVLLRGGAFQWFKIPKEALEDRLLRFKSAGYNTIDMYLSWRNHESEEGKFDFKKFDVEHFLSLAKKHHMYVIFRPGPYICNEMDAGGLPGWLIAKANKSILDKNKKDGSYNLRTDEKDFLHAVQKYYQEVNQIIKPYLHTNGGPIILYSIENEYDWFLILKDFDQYSTVNGHIERPKNQKIDVKNYLEKLTGFAVNDGIDVPITTCPGSGKIAGLDQARNLIPMPNMYTGLKNAEYQTQKLREDMHSDKHNGMYKNIPLGLTETERESNVLRRLILGGMNSVIQFNNIGFFQQDYQNAVLINGFLTDNLTGVAKFLSRMVNLKHPRTSFLRPSIGFYPGKGDYFGSAISPSGILRDRFFNLRRANLFLESFEPMIAKAYKPFRTFDNKNILDQDQRVCIKNHGTGILDPDYPRDRVNYWLPLGKNSALIGILNDGKSNRNLGKNSITAFGESFPKYSNLHVPTEYGINTSSSLNTPDNEYTMFVPYNFPLSKSVQLKYSTSEILTLKDFEDEKLLVVYGKSKTEGELKLEGKEIQIISKTPGITVHEKSANHVTISYPHGTPHSFAYKDQSGENYRILVLDTYMAGKTWFTPTKSGMIMVSGPDYVNTLADKTQLEFSSLSKTNLLYTYSKNPIQISQSKPIRDFDNKTGLSIVKITESFPEIFPKLDLSVGKVQSDIAESDPLHATDHWISLGNKPSNVEKHGIYHGHSWYRGDFHLDKNDLLKKPSLWIEHLSDFGAIYINGHYINTLTPIGTEINNNSKDSSYRFQIPTHILQEGKNTIAFKTEIWGHGGIAIPHGKLNRINLLGKSIEIPLVRFRIPSLSYDSKKGMSGDATFNDKPIMNWKLKPNLGGIEREYHKPNFNDEKWKTIKVPIVLSKGDVLWYRTTFHSKEFPQNENWFVPMSLKLKGKNAKASIYLNGRLIGRWLSDNDWMKKGGWFQPVREMWTTSSVDEFPVCKNSLKPGKNVISIAFEDTSDTMNKNSKGIIDEISLKVSKEGTIMGYDGIENKEVIHQKITLS
jgi:hypothetical protein